jgi:uncharacterized cupin superfamily protein
MMGKKHSNVTNLNEIEPRIEKKGTRFGYAARRLGMASGGREIGCSWYEIPPGRTAFPYHFHCANEEALFILEGAGEMRIGEKTVPVETGDYIALPVGPDHTHSIKNTGKDPLKCLCLSTMHLTEVVAYPDSKKIGAAGTDDPSKGFAGAWVKALIQEQAPVDYYEGEKIDES